MIVCNNCTHQEMEGALYCSMCGARLIADREEKQVFFFIADSGEKIELKGKEKYVIGRITDEQLAMPDIDLSPFNAYGLGVSRLHALLTRVGGGYKIQDLGSSNGTRINGQTILPHVDYPVKSGDEIILGKLKVQFLM